MVTDGTWSNVWNGENRPVLIEPMNPSNGSERVELAYDYQGRRIKEEISVYSGSVWSVVRTNLWLYDGWNPVQEVVLTASGIETNWWTHGLDLSGTLQSAGGIGGFLAWTRASDGKTFLYSGDANGNITELVDASNPTNIVASYQWDAYGDPIAVTGDEAENNVFRWSSKYVIVQTGDKDFGYRILRDHRWVSRDPIGERGGKNLLNFSDGNAINYWDYLGTSSDAIGVVNSEAACNQALSDFWKNHKAWQDRKDAYEKEGCKLHIRCKCCHDYGEAQARIDDDFLKPDWLPKDIDVSICYNKRHYLHGYEGTIAHELVHYFDKCSGKTLIGCDQFKFGSKEDKICRCANRTCEEMRAWNLTGACRGMTPAGCARFVGVDRAYWHQRRDAWYDDCGKPMRDGDITIEEVAEYAGKHCPLMDNLPPAPDWEEPIYPHKERP